MPLTDLKVKNSKPQSKDYWLSDEKGLRLLVKKSGARYWRMKYRFAGKQKTLAIGVYPEISLKQARVERDDARLKLREGVDPNRDKQAQKQRALMEEGKLFSVLALEWWEHYKNMWTEDHARRIWLRLSDNSFKEMDLKPITQIEPQDIIAVINAIEQRGALDVAKRVLQDIRRVFRYGVQVSKLRYNPATELTGIIKPYKTQHRASLPNNELGQFLFDLQSYESQGRLLTQLAIQLLVLTFVRPGEIRVAKWNEFETENRLWRIPAERMKMKTEHLVPISDQALNILEKLRPITGQYDLLFPSEKNRKASMSDNTMRTAIFRMGYDGKTKGKSRMTPHGFRANASSILNEQGFNPDAIERQLSHMERSGVRAAYMHHAHFLNDRKMMMQWWADFLDQQIAEFRLDYVG